MPQFAAAELVNELPSNLFGVLEKMAAAIDTRNKPLIDLSSGSPRQPAPAAIIAELQEAVGRPENHEYPSFWGKPQVRQAIADFYQRQYGVTLDPDTEIAVFHGSHIGITGVPRALVNPGQYIIATDPCFPTFRNVAKQAQAQFWGIPVNAENDFVPDFNSVPEEVARNAGLLVLNYPHNPTGALATPELFADALAWAQRYQLPVLNDFAYAAIGASEGGAPISLLAQPGGKEWGVETYTLSKTFNMAGWRFGFAVGNASIIQALKKLHTHSYSTVFGAVQDAATVALNLADSDIDPHLAVYPRRRTLVEQRLAQLGWPVRHGQGSFFLWLEVPPGFTSQQLTEHLLQQAHVLVVPGTGFGPGGEGYIRISLTASDAELGEAFDRIAALKLFR
ncbi:aminotransferase class I/II-fold pyridoxal phosphate-dependent enzyme [Pantoea sp. A4]|uniref:aminotransferase class I/II-fold pyridoxal phosphate-dependent enzyme n=1 Tax=Pantoea sp. A4 TaxID=1225184 RepID=UPI000475306E|nr:aminotransferase class I/II-fold pyridoxal phosphate-dependent enzyme [Pantoea sp. A4]